ncbi:DNA-directed RNA polymerase I subunit RPA1-like [Homarus americanus]|uniref:DNA-directed RNA polymerase subunit n=1 Tax=Homarus americanus TaxID=6706 RepID=A0A8J5JNN5_HOMAM|nr:DNA-directed RNA polymerase I subunit RPA1-like [Homarus americanus]
MGSYGQVGFTCVKDLLFRVYTDKEVQQISVVKLTNDESINELGHFAADGLYDLRMGPMSTRERDVCETCGQDGLRCLGHCGHIEMPLPVYNPFFYGVLSKLLYGICNHCFRFQAPDYRVIQLLYQSKLLDEGYAKEALNVKDTVARITSHGDESQEISTGINDRVIRGSLKSYENVELMQILSETLKKYCKEVMKGGTSSHETSTSNVKAVQDQVIKSFFDDCKAKLSCKFCRRPLMKLSLKNSRFMKATIKMKLKKSKSDDEEESVSSGLVVDGQSYITCDQARAILRKCWAREEGLLKCLYPILASSKSEHPTDMFFLSTLLVIPPKYRPCNTQDGLVVEHDTSVLLKNVVRMSRVLTFLISIVNGSISELPETIEYILSQIPGNTPIEKMQGTWHNMQASVDNLFDTNLNPTMKNSLRGLRQVIEKKHGLFRRNLMGKRVNYSARSVAAPDPLLAVDEVGVPMDFAKRLSYPVPVTQWNVEKLRQLVKNGPEVYPGAVMVEDEEGKKKRLSSTDEKQRNAVANKLLTPTESHVRKVNATKIVYRHLQNGDFVLMNRQPTLHRPSIQAHRARIMLNDRVFRMPYANCKAYNADFDGDELNLHFPQNEIARSEAQHLVTTHNQYLTPKDGSPLAGLIQDCVVASVMLTMRGKFFAREDYQQLIYTGLSDQSERIKLLPPAIIKPKKLWSGKQVISSLLLNIIPENKARPSFTFKTSVKADLWQTNEERAWKAGGPPEKKREAMTDSDFVMRDGELLSGVIDKSAIGSTSHGLIHVCYDLYGGGVSSKLLTAINRLCVYYLKWTGHTISVKEFATPSHVSARRRAALHRLVQNASSEVSRKLNITEESFQDYFEKLHMSHSEVEMAAIDAAYTSVLAPTTSQVTGDNERGLLRRGLDNHMRMMVDTGAKGSKVNMNQMASLFGSVAIDGKRMPLSITGKTLPSFKAYDPNPRSGGYIPNRFMTGINPQSYFFLCIVGRDNPHTLDVLVKNYSRLLDERSLSIAKSVGEKKLVDKYKMKLKKWHKKANERKVRNSAFLKFCKKTAATVESSGFNKDTGRANISRELQDMWQQLTPEEKKKYNKNIKCPDPVNSIFSGASNLGVVSEALDDLIERYYEENYHKQPQQQQNLTQKQVATSVHMKVLTSMVDPGEAVGALCAQMTLNTFHFAGRDELNVTLGVPRMVEILRTASRNISTPIMELPFYPHVKRSQAEFLRVKLSEVSLSKVLHGLEVTSRLEKDEKLRVHRRTKVKLTFLPHRDYKKMFAVNPSQVLNYVEREFIPKILLKEIKNSFGKTKKMCSTITEENKDSDGDDENNDNIELDAAKETKKSKKKMKANYGVESSEEEDEDDFQQEAPEDTDATSSSRSKKRQEQDYSEDEEAELVSEEEGDQETVKEQLLPQDEEENQSQEDIMDGEDVRKHKKGISLKEAEVRKETLLNSDSWIIDYDFDREKELWCEVSISLQNFGVLCEYKSPELWCEVTLVLPINGGNYDIPSIVRQRSQRALIHYVRGIRRVFVVEKDDTLLLRVDGVNILKMFQYEHMLNVNCLYTNNIHQVAEIYGIEAAQRSIIRELRAVQSVYDIKVDFRHLTLLAEYFT